MRSFVVLLLCMTSSAWLTTPSSPRLRGLLRPSRVTPTMQAGDNAQLDALITSLRSSTPDELPKLLAENLKIIDQRLFLRLAELSDLEEDDYEKLRIRQLATLVASSLETIFEKADEAMDADADSVQQLLRTMATESGEFELPVPAARLDALRASVREKLATLDEGFVGTVKAYMQKASDDGLEGMVDVLRVLLQMFAAERLRALTSAALADGGAPGAALAAMLEASPEEWDGVLDERVSGDAAECSAEDVLNVLQDRMGEVVLGMPAGSAVQTVLAEYLSELIGKTRAIAEVE